MMCIYLIGVALAYSVHGFVELSSNNPYTNSRPYLQQNTPDIQNAQGRNGESARYVQFPEAFSEHGVQYHQPFGIKPSDIKASHIPEPIPYAFSPQGSKPHEVTDQHFLTRPQSIVITPTGQHYIPHLINPRPFPSPPNIPLERPFFQHEPLSEFIKPRITIFAKNIFINNENSKTPYADLPHRSVPYAVQAELFSKLSSLFKSDFPNKKTLLLDLLLSSYKPEEIVMENILDVTDYETLKRPTDMFHVKPDLSHQYPKPQGAIGTLIRPAVHNGATFQSPVPLVQKPSSSSPFLTTQDKEGVIHQALAQKEQVDPKDFNPLLKPIVKEPDVDNEFRDEDKDNETTMVAVTGLDNMSIEEESPHKATDEEEATEEQFEN